VRKNSGHYQKQKLSELPGPPHNINPLLNLKALSLESTRTPPRNLISNARKAPALWLRWMESRR